MRRCRGMVMIFMVLVLPILAAAQGATPAPRDISWYAIVALVLSNIGMWIREGRKHKHWKAKNGTEEETKVQVEAMDGKVDLLLNGQTELATEISGMKTLCATTSGALSERIGANADNIFALAKNNKKGG